MRWGETLSSLLSGRAVLAISDVRMPPQALDCCEYRSSCGLIILRDARELWFPQQSRAFGGIQMRGDSRPAFVALVTKLIVLPHFLRCQCARVEFHFIKQAVEVGGVGEFVVAEAEMK